MALIDCPECGARISEKAAACPKCGHPMKPMADLTFMTRRFMRGYEWKSKTEILGWPLIHIAVGRNKETGKLLKSIFTGFFILLLVEGIIVPSYILRFLLQGATAVGFFYFIKSKFYNEN